MNTNLAELPDNPRDRGAMLANAVVFDLRLRNGETLESIKQSMRINKNPRVHPKGIAGGR